VEEPLPKGITAGILLQIVSGLCMPESGVLSYTSLHYCCRSLGLFILPRVQKLQQNSNISFIMISRVLLTQFDVMILTIVPVNKRLHYDYHN